MNCQDLWARFARPDNAYRIVPLVRINDAVDRDEAFRQVRSLKEQGCGGLFTYCEHLRDQAPFRFLSPEWWAAVRVFAEACVDQGLDFWAYDEQDWPSGTSGGQLVEQNPDMGWKYLHTTEHDVDGPAAARVEVGTGTLVAALAFQVKGDAVLEDSVRNLTDGVADGLLAWDVPEGPWRIAVYTWHLGQGGAVIPFSSDLMEARVGRKFVELSYQGYREAVGQVPGARVAGYFTDEPIFSMGLYPTQRYVPERPATALAWTPGLLEAFRAQQGYDLRPRLPDLHYGGGRLAVRTRCHYFETCSRLFCENYFGQIHRFCETTGALATGHLNGEETFAVHLASQGGNQLVHYRHMDVPGIDWILPRSTPLPAVAAGYATSIAHLLGRERTWCESFAGSGWGLTFQQMRGIVNWEHASGINMQIPISYKYSLRGPARTTFYNPGISWQQPYWDHFRAFADYEARLCALAAGGGHVAQVALFYPAADMQAHFREPDLLNRRSKDYSDLGDRLRYAGYDFDILDDHMLLEETGIDAGRLRTATESFEVLVVPRMDVLRRAALEKVFAFVRRGGAVLFVGHLPRHSVEAGADDPDLRRLLVELLGDDCHGRMAGGDRFWRTCGAGRAGVAPDAAGAVTLLQALIAPDLTTTPADARIVACHRRLEDGDLYLLLNHSDEARTVSLTLRSKGHPERWDPLTGAAEGIGAYGVADSRTTFRLDFQPRELIPVVLHADAAQARSATTATLLQKIPVPGPFRFRIEETLKRPGTAWNFSDVEREWTSHAEPLKVPETIQAGDWCEHGLRFFSGIGHYETDVELQALPDAARVVLSLGRVGVSAEVSVNGKRAGFVLFDPYEIDVTACVAPGRNRLTISVANTLANYYSQFSELAGKEPFEGGILPEDLASGLVGPVSLKVFELRTAYPHGEPSRVAR